MKKILVVEDDADINRALGIRLRAAGYAVVTAMDSYSGFKLALEEKPDLMILDISMPAGDGFSIVERIRESGECDEPPFIMLTASKRTEYREQAAMLGAAAYFEKPFESSALLAAVQQAVAGGWNLNV